MGALSFSFLCAFPFLGRKAGPKHYFQSGGAQRLSSSRSEGIFIIRKSNKKSQDREPDVGSIPRLGGVFCGRLFGLLANRQRPLGPSQKLTEPEDGCLVNRSPFPIASQETKTQNTAGDGKEKAAVNPRDHRHPWPLCLSVRPPQLNRSDPLSSEGEDRCQVVRVGDNRETRGLGWGANVGINVQPKENSFIPTL